MRFWVAVIDCFREIRDDRYIGNSQLELHFAGRPTEEEMLREAAKQFPNRVYNVRTLIERCPELEDPAKDVLDLNFEDDARIYRAILAQMDNAHVFGHVESQRSVEPPQHARLFDRTYIAEEAPRHG